MESILKEVKSSHTTDGTSNTETFVIREATKSQPQPAVAAVSQTALSIVSSPAELAISSHDDVLRVLQNEPDIDTLLTTIRWLNSTAGQQALDLRLPGPAQARIIHHLVDSILPSCWQALDASGQKALAECLTSIAGMKALVALSRRLLSQRSKPGPSDSTIIDLLEALSTIVRPHDTFTKLWSGLCTRSPDEVKLNLVWKEVVNFFGSHVLDEVRREAYSKLGKDKTSRLDLAMSAAWFAANVLHLASKTSQSCGPDNIQAASKLFARSFDVNYAQKACVLIVAHDCLSVTPVDAGHNVDMLISLVTPMQRSEKRRCIDTLLDCLASTHGLTLASRLDESHAQAQIVPAVARLLHILTDRDAEIRQELAKSITDTLSLTRSPFLLRQAAILALVNTTPNEVPGLLTKAISTFGDQLFIDHGLIPRQDAIAHTILIGASYLHRNQPSLVTTAMRSSGFMQGVSNRLAASSPRARWLGMTVSTAMSRLVDRPDMQMNFGTADMETQDAKHWLDLVNAEDRLGDLKEVVTLLESSLTPQTMVKRTKKRERITELPLINGKQSFGPPRPPSMAQTEVQGQKVTELTDATIYEEDLKPYAKPDSDPEDSEEDATLVNRNKARPPVYIRTLMSMLRDSENVERFQLAVKHAAPLIRRKTGFGREVSDHAEELARILSNLQDPFETEDFDDMRLQALIALVLSNVPVIAPWLSRQAFAKDYSIAQRSIMLTAIGLSGRELAGYKHEDQLNRSFNNATFPSKQLPDKLRAIYDSPGRSLMLDMAAEKVEQAMIQPMALKAADQTTSQLDAVKVHKFSSRMDVERTRRKPTTNELAKVFGTAFFQPLLACIQQEMAAFGDQGIYFSTPILLTAFLKTLAILLHASGPVTLGLVDITADFWEMLLLLRVRATSDVTIMEAVLFGFLTLLEVNENKQDLAQNSPKQLMETKEWAEMIFERTGGGALIEGEGEEARIRTLCAGVLTKASEIISAYQKILMGSWTGL